MKEFEKKDGTAIVVLFRLVHPARCLWYNAGCAWADRCSGC